MAELNSPEAILSCRVSKPKLGVPYSESWFGRKGFAECIPMEPGQVGLVTSIFSVGGLIGLTYVGRLADDFGRKRTSIIASIVYIVGGLFNTFANLYTGLLLGRFVVGLGAGAALVITPMFINEVAPNDYKGFFGAMNQVSINVGILITQTLALWWSNNNDWRLLLGAAVVIAAINLILVVFYVEESPVWLVNKGFTGEAIKNLHFLRGGDYNDARDEINTWAAHHTSLGSQTPRSVGAESDGLLNSVGELEAGEPTTSSSGTVDLGTYLKSPEYKNSRVVATGILILQQLCGINSIIFYGVSVLVSIFPNYAVVINFLISIVNVVVTFVSGTLLDKLGRKPLLLASVSTMGAATVFIGFGIIYTNAFLSIVGIFTYIIFFAIGLGPIPFLIVGEVTQPRAKASAQSWGTAMNWCATFTVGYSFPILKNSSLGGAVYFLFTFLCFFTYLFVDKYIPETKNTKTYEEVWGLS